VTTVSRILNGQQAHKEETMRRVWKVIEEIGYKPNAIARGLVKRTSDTIGILLPSLTSSFTAALLDGVITTARQKQHSVITCHTGLDGRDTIEYLKVLGEQQVKGVIFASGQVKQEYVSTARKMKLSLVLVSTISDRHPIPFIKVNDRQAAYQATTYLIEKGHRKIGLISGNKDDPISGIPRFEGYKQALQDADIQFVEERVAYGDFRFASGVKGLERLLHTGPDITAVFATSDEMAVGALSCAYRHGITVPDALSVIGYDDTQQAEMTIPPLTCVHQPIYEMGEKAVEMLLDDDSAGQSIFMPFHIVERETVRTIQ
jgi:LacI family transcriptional regulator